MPHRDDFDDDLLDTDSDAFDYKPVSSDEGSGSKAVKLILAVSVIAALGGAAWYFVGGTPMDQDQVPIVRAEPSPMKEKPQDPGGMDVPNRDKTVYDRVSGENTEPKLERLLPRPEKPLDKPAQTLGEIEAETTAAGITKSLPPLPETPEEVAEAVAQTPAPVEEVKELPAVPTEEMATEIEAPTPAPVEDPNGPRALVKRSEQPLAVDKQDKDDLAAKIAEALQEPKTQAPKQVAAATPPAPKPTATENPTSGYLMQILSSKSESGVETTWKKIKANNGDIVNGLNANIVKADLGDKGIYYRLRLGPVQSGDEAKNICAKLKKRDVGCFIVRVR
ncbi:SPOR domain-containing protein [Terasakiella pusilla]|uniref:SPOR domain-containing protein n=1 Tax=Terasakiella pusilla TaxID=64973 RepID=UPI003AA9CE9B